MSSEGVNLGGDLGVNLGTSISAVAWVNLGALSAGSRLLRRRLGRRRLVWLRLRLRRGAPHFLTATGVLPFLPFGRETGEVRQFPLSPHTADLCRISRTFLPAGGLFRLPAACRRRVGCTAWSRLGGGGRGGSSGGRGGSGGGRGGARRSQGEARVSCRCEGQGAGGGLARAQEQLAQWQPWGRVSRTVGCVLL